jgi:hypothetical protein
MKKKLRLNLEDLRVESFDTSPVQGAQRGTVRGQDTQFGTCGTEQTCELTCGSAGGCGFMSETCVPLNCPDPTWLYDTCNCADQSRAGWASCGTTCQGNQTVCICDTGTGQTGYATCTCTEPTTEGDTAYGCPGTTPGMVC